MLNKEFLYRKVKLIQEDLAKLETLSSFSYEELCADPIRSDAVERILEKIITRAIDINRHILSAIGNGTEEVRTYHDTFLRMKDCGVYPETFAKKIASSAGLRNILVHEYDEVDMHILYASMKDALSQYSEYCQHIITLCEK